MARAWTRLTERGRACSRDSAFPQAKRMKDLEKKNQRRKKLLAELSLDRAMLEELAKGSC